MVELKAGLDDHPDRGAWTSQWFRGRQPDLRAEGSEAGGTLGFGIWVSGRRPLVTLVVTRLDIHVGASDAGFAASAIRTRRIFMGSWSKKGRDILRPAYWHLAGRLPLAIRRHYLHTVGTRRRGDFINPQTFNEKINWRIINDRREIISQACDKLRMKEIARAAVPEGELRIPETLWSGLSLRDAPELSTLPAWVLKPNHSSGHVVLGPTQDTRAELEGRTASWLRSAPAVDLGEWGYGQARPLLLIEERVPSAAKVPVDYKFFVFDGEVKLIQVNSGRYTDDPHLTFYYPNWRPVPVVHWGWSTFDDPRPDNLEEMIAIAARLGAGYDCIRVDLYSAEGEVWFGEYTVYPCGGVTRFVPASFDRAFGEMWSLPPLEDVQARLGAKETL